MVKGFTVVGYNGLAVQDFGCRSEGGGGMAVVGRKGSEGKGLTGAGVPAAKMLHDFILQQI